MASLGNRGLRLAFWLLLVVFLTSTLMGTPLIRAAGPNYVLVGYVTQPSGGPALPGVTVDLMSQATHTVYTTTTLPGTSGQFKFTLTNTQGALAPGWWGVWVPPQANDSLIGCTPCAVQPQNPNPVFAYQSAQSLTSSISPVEITGVGLAAYNAVLTGTVNYLGSPYPGAIVQLLNPTYDNFALCNNTTTASGTFSLRVPMGTYVFEAIIPGPTAYYNYTKVVVNSGSKALGTINVNNYIVSGTEYLSSNPSARVPNGGNVTLYDPYNGYIYSAPTYPGGYYAIGSYSNFSSGGKQPFDVILSPTDFGTAYYPISVGPAGGLVRNVYLTPIAPPARYLTTLNFSQINTTRGTGSLAVSTQATLLNDSTIPILANTSVGQIWAQLGLDFDHSTNFASASWPAVANWINSTGPFFPAVQAGTSVNGTLFAQPSTGYTFTNSTTCSGSCGLTSAATISLGWSQSYRLNGTIPAGRDRYSIGFSFRHPTNSESINYTVVLPAGFSLAAGAQVPANTKLVPDAEGTWTTFTLVSQPSPTAGGTASFTIVKYTNVTANVNVTASSFTFSTHNVLNSTHGNYTAILGPNEVASFTGLNSTFPAGTNGTRFAWVWGDGGSNTTGSPSINHTYAVSHPYPYNGTLTVTSSGGLTNSTTFYVWVAQGPAVANITTNATASEGKKTSSGTYYLMLNWSRNLQLNASLSTSTISSGSGAPADVISVASWTVVAHSYNRTANYSWSAGVNPFSNLTLPLLGAGLYLSNGTIGSVRVPFLGWQYTVTLTVWDAAGFQSTTTLNLLVRDTQRPIASFQLLNSNGGVITGSGVVEGTNQTAMVQFNARNSTDPNNGTVVRYVWNVTNNQSGYARRLPLQSSTPSYLPAATPYPRLWLAPSVRPYNVNLTITDRAGNVAYTTGTVTVSVNSVTRPIMKASNLTGPGTLTAGSSYTYWVNVTTGGGTQAVAQNVTVNWYTLAPNGGGSPSYIVSNHSVQFYNYTSPGVPNSAPFATGTTTLTYNQTIRALIHWTPSTSGNFVLYANVTASNEFAGSYPSGPQITQKSITVNPNPLTLALEYGAIAAVAIVVIVLLIIFYRRRVSRGTTKPSSSRSGLIRGKRPADEDDEDEN